MSWPQGTPSLSTEPVGENPARNPPLRGLSSQKVQDFGGSLGWTRDYVAVSPKPHSRWSLTHPHISYVCMHMCMYVHMWVHVCMHMGMCVHVFARVCARTHMWVYRHGCMCHWHVWRSENDFQDLVLFFYHGPRGSTQLAWLKWQVILFADLSQRPQFYSFSHCFSHTVSTNLMFVSSSRRWACAEELAVWDSQLRAGCITDDFYVGRYGLFIQL